MSFAPVDVWPLAYVCLTPWLVMVAASESGRRVYLLSYLLGVGFFNISIYWLYMVTIGGAALLFLMFAVHFPVVACPLRHLVRRRRWPMAVVFPFLWVGSEALRSMVLLPFPWNLLGHSHHHVLTMIQISDLVGAYGVSFVLASANGLAADLLLAWHARRRGLAAVPRGRLRWLGPSFCAGLLVFTLAYGVVQRNRHTTSEGPLVAVIQGNYLNYVDLDREEATPRQRADRYQELMLQASADRPDLYLLPESAWHMNINREFREHLTYWYRPEFAYTPQDCFEFFRDFAARFAADVVVGSLSIEPTPLDLRASDRRYNSAFVFSPDGAEPARYDKRHLVLVGEYVPFRYGPLRFFYLWLSSRLPFAQEGEEYSLWPGAEFKTFTMSAHTQNGRTYGFATPICYENVTPYVSRTFVTGPDHRKRCDFLLNMSNDGWFADSWELPQHLAASVFRAVENRVGVARAVNTGISCFIDPDGRVHDVVTKNGRTVGPGVDGYRVARVLVDSRHSLYSRTGDWFAVACVVLGVLCYVDYVVARAAVGRARGRGTV